MLTMNLPDEMKDQKKIETIRKHAGDIMLEKRYPLARVYEDFTEAMYRFRQAEESKRWPRNHFNRRLRHGTGLLFAPPSVRIAQTVVLHGSCLPERIRQQDLHCGASGRL